MFFFGNISFSFTKDKIVNNVFQRDAVVQETRYLNSDGFYTVLGFYNYSKPIQNRKYVFNYGGNVTYNNNVSYVSDKKNTGKISISDRQIFRMRKDKVYAYTRKCKR